MSGRNTLTNLLAYLEALTALVDEGHPVDVLYLDFAEAFDKVPHARLMPSVRSWVLMERSYHGSRNGCQDANRGSF